MVRCLLQDTSGSIRDAKGAFGKKEKAIEDQYFHNLVSVLYLDVNIYILYSIA